MRYRYCGYDPPEPDDGPRCPVCGEPAEILYINFVGEVFGCDNCVIKADYQYWEEVRESARSDLRFDRRHEPAGVAGASA